jgi:hypothetical protein
MPQHKLKKEDLVNVNEDHEYKVHIIQCKVEDKMHRKINSKNNYKNLKEK